MIISYVPNFAHGTLLRQQLLEKMFNPENMTFPNAEVTDKMGNVCCQQHPGDFLCRKTMNLISKNMGSKQLEMDATRVTLW